MPFILGMLGHSVACAVWLETRGTNHVWGTGASPFRLEVGRTPPPVQEAASGITAVAGAAFV